MSNTVRRMTNAVARLSRLSFAAAFAFAITLGVLHAPPAAAQQQRAARVSEADVALGLQACADVALPHQAIARPRVAPLPPALLPPHRWQPQVLHAEGGAAVVGIKRAPPKGVQVLIVSRVSHAFCMHGVFVGGSSRCMRGQQIADTGG